MDKYAVFGNPIKHSLSPAIHTQFAKQTGLDISYEKISAPVDDFASYANDFINKGGLGFNVTVPFKLDGFKLATKLTENAKVAGAVNTIKVENKNLLGENTDGIGLVNDLTKNLNINLEGKIILILGAGGATRGILMPLLKKKPRRVMIANRTSSKAHKLKKEFTKYGKICGFGLEKIKPTPAVDIIINATSASLNGEMPNIPSEIANKTICYELMYGSKTPFMRWAKNNNAKMIIDGLGMLVEQAASSFEFWTGKKPDTKKILTKL